MRDLKNFSRIINFVVLIITPTILTSLLLIGNPNINYSILLIFFLLLIIIIGARKMNQVQKRRLILSPTNLFSGFYILLYVVMAFDALFIQGQINGDNNLTILIVSIAIAALGYVFFFIGFMLPIGKKMSRVIPKFSFQWNSNKTIVISLLLILISLVSSWLVIRGSGGLLDHINQLSSRRILFLYRGYLIALDNLSFVNLFIVFSYYLDTRKGKFLLLLSAFTAIFVLIIHGSRISFLVITLVLLMIYIYKGNTVSKRFIILTLSILSALAVYYGAFTREVLPYGQLVYGSLNSSQIVNFTTLLDFILQFWDRLSRLNFDSLSRLQLILPKVPNEFDFLYGRSFLGIFSYFMPRIFFPDKPLTIGMLFTKTFYPISYSNGGGVTPSLLVDLYWNFGVFGIIIGMLCFGIFIRSIVSYAENSNFNSGAVIILAVISSQIFGWLKSGSDTPTQMTLMFLIPTVFIFILFSFNQNKVRKNRME